MVCFKEISTTFKTHNDGACLLTTMYHLTGFHYKNIMQELERINQQQQFEKINNVFGRFTSNLIDQSNCEVTNVVNSW